MKLTNKVALITSASKGIGKGIARRYAQEGAAVVIASRSVELLSGIAQEINSRGRRALALKVDVRKSESIQSTVDRAVEHFGRLDIMVNNAGISMAHPSEDLSPDDWTRAM